LISIINRSQFLAESAVNPEVHAGGRGAFQEIGVEGANDRADDSHAAQALKTELSVDIQLYFLQLLAVLLHEVEHSAHPQPFLGVRLQHLPYELLDPRCHLAALALLHPPVLQLQQDLEVPALELERRTAK